MLHAVLHFLRIPNCAHHRLEIYTECSTRVKLGSSPYSNLVLSPASWILPGSLLALPHGYASPVGEIKRSVTHTGWGGVTSVVCTPVCACVSNHVKGGATHTFLLWPKSKAPVNSSCWWVARRVAKGGKVWLTIDTPRHPFRRQGSGYYPHCQL